MTLPRELEFLEHHFEDPASFYRQAQWLLNDFEAEVWHYSFGFKKHQELDWRVELSDGSLLTDLENAVLLNSLKYWLIGTTVPKGKTGFANGDDAQYNAFNRTLHLIDYLLLNDDSFKLHRYGLEGLSEDDLKGILSQVSTSSDVYESLFDWSYKLIEFAQSLLQSSSLVEINESLNASPGMGIITADDELEAKSLGIEPNTLPHLRAALKFHGFITQNRKLGRAPNSKAISEHVYIRSVRQRHVDKPASVTCLSYSALTEMHVREYEPVSVTTGSKQNLSAQGYAFYRSALYNLGILYEIGLPAPSMDSLIAANHHPHPAPEAHGRFRTLPSQVVFDSVKDAIEFHFKNGRQILNGYLRLVLAARRKNCSIRAFTSSDIQEIIGADLKNLGVNTLELSGVAVDNRSRDIRYQQRLSRPEYFNALRRNQGLLELVYVYFGAVQVVAGSLAARRGGELREIEARKALDSSERWLFFQNRKSTRSLMGLRSTEARPIEPIAAEMIKELVRFHKILLRIGITKNDVELFSPPSRRGDNKLVNAAAYIFNHCFDMFCDYFETSLNAEGKRYYIRQHQLRRFFALLFFHSSSFGGLETLQWMLGHTDLKHVWHYITESMSGDVLRSAKSQFVAESLHHNEAENFKELSALLKSRYGTDDFTIIDTDELEDYIEDLLESGEIEIEPEFFTDADGEKMRVIVKVRELDGTEA